MSYKNTLTILNKAARKSAIVSMYNVARTTGSYFCYVVVLQWMFEYICAYFYINTEEDIVFKEIMKRFNINMETRKLLNIWHSVRSSIAHGILPLNKSLVYAMSKCVLDEAFNNFEEDKNIFMEMYIDCCEEILHNKEQYGDFDVLEYLKDYVYLLPVASVNSCKTKEDCDNLLSRLGIK